jgi:hypothetical protein
MYRVIECFQNFSEFDNKPELGPSLEPGRTSKIQSILRIYAGILETIPEFGTHQNVDPPRNRDPAINRQPTMTTSHSTSYYYELKGKERRYKGTDAMKM